MSNFQFSDFNANHEGDEANFLIGCLLGGVHLAIVQECGESAGSQNKICIAFPNCDLGRGLHGGVLRVFAQEDVMGRLLRHPALFRFVQSLSVQPKQVPTVTTFEVIKRMRVLDKTTPSARRRMERRQSESRSTHRKIPPSFAITVRSATSGQHFPLRCDVRPHEFVKDGLFNTYGLSAGGSVPSFTE